MTTSAQSQALSEALAGAALSTTRPTAAAAFARARELFNQGERIDMARIADDLGVARTTLYRWTGDRDQLISDVLWAESKQTIDQLLAHTDPGDMPTCQVIGAGFIEVVAGSPAVHAFLRTEGQRALLLLTVPTSTYRTRLMQALIELIERDAERGYRPPETPELLADSIISLGERFLHNAGEPDANPSPEMAQRAIALLLRE
jgi:AcrR family transcriptional regulator